MVGSLRSAFVIFLLSAQLATAQALPEGMTMHRMLAGNPDSTGWTDARSTRGGFSVRMPLKFNDFTMRMPDREAHLAMMFGVGAKSSEGVKIAAQRFVYRKKDAAAHFFSRVQGGTGFKTKPKNVKAHNFQGRPAVDLELANEGATGYLRYVLMDDSLIYLIVEVPNGARALVPNQLVQKYFDSLRFTPLDSPKVGSSG